MRIEIKVIPGAKKNAVNQERGAWRVYVQVLAADGKANKALIGLLAKHFKVRKSQIEIIKGLKSRHKTISIESI